MENQKSFRESMDRLDTIVTQLEKNDVELEDAIQLFEEGLHLVKSCDSQLRYFENQVGTLLKTYKEVDSNDED